VPQLRIPGVQDIGNVLVWGAKNDKPMLAPPMDSLRIDVIPLASAAPTENISDNVLRPFLTNLRVASGQWWITRSIDPLVGWIRNSFRCDESGKILGGPDAPVAARTPTGHERPISEPLWIQALASAERGDNPDLHDVLMLDAHFHAVTSEHRHLCSTQLQQLKVSRSAFLRSFGQNLTTAYTVEGRFWPDMTCHAILIRTFIGFAVDLSKLNSQKHFALSSGCGMPEAMLHMGTAHSIENRVFALTLLTTTGDSS
jgi:hypothetical protein